MKNYIRIFSLLYVFVLFSSYNNHLVRANDENVFLQSNHENMPPIQTLGESSLLMEYTSGKVIFAKNEHEKMYPASMTKMMGMLLILNAVVEGRLTMEEEVQVSASAASMGGTQIFLQPGEVMCVEDLFKSVAINSANDAMFALGEKVEGSEFAFVKMMNDKAKELGMKNTNFVNMVGFDDENHYSTAYDMAILGKELLRHGDNILKYTSQYDGYVRQNTANPFWLVNTNKLVLFYNGMDGLKTGFTQRSKYCLTATANRNNLRFIAVSMGNSTINERSQDITGMLNYGFAFYKSLHLFSKGEVIRELNHPNNNYYKNKKLIYVVNNDINCFIKKTNDIESLLIAIDHPNIDKKDARLIIINDMGIKYEYKLSVIIQTYQRMDSKYEMLYFSILSLCIIIFYLIYLRNFLNPLTPYSL